MRRWFYCLCLLLRSLLCRDIQRIHCCKYNHVGYSWLFLHISWNRPMQAHPSTYIDLNTPIGSALLHETSSCMPLSISLLRRLQGIPQEQGRQLWERAQSWWLNVALLRDMYGVKMYKQQVAFRDMHPSNCVRFLHKHRPYTDEGSSGRPRLLRTWLHEKKVTEDPEKRDRVGPGISILRQRWFWWGSEWGTGTNLWMPDEPSNMPVK